MTSCMCCSSWSESEFIPWSSQSNISSCCCLWYPVSSRMWPDLSWPIRSEINRRLRCWSTICDSHRKRLAHLLLPWTRLLEWDAPHKHETWKSTGVATMQREQRHRKRGWPRETPTWRYNDFSLLGLNTNHVRHVLYIYTHIYILYT